MRYMLLIYDDEHTRTDDDMDLKPWMEYTASAQAAGVYEAGAGLLPTETATTVRKREGERLVTDGPFAETKEQLGGYYLLECKDLDEALECAAKIPSARHGSIEVRPIMKFD